MSDGTLLILAFVAATAGMSGFAMANEGHWRQLLGTRPQSDVARALCKVAGALLLGLSFLLCTLADSGSMAILVWPMLLGVAAAMVAALLTLRARRGAARKS